MKWKEIEVSSKFVGYLGEIFCGNSKRFRPFSQQVEHSSWPNIDDGCSVEIVFRRLTSSCDGNVFDINFVRFPSSLGYHSCRIIRLFYRYSVKNCSFCFQMNSRGISFGWNDMNSCREGLQFSINLNFERFMNFSLICVSNELKKKFHSFLQNLKV